MPMFSFDNIGRWVADDLLRLQPETRLSEAVAFVVGDTAKILVMLAALIFVVGVLRTFLSQDRIRAWMTRSGLPGYVLAALAGAITPFCSCSSIPIFFAFLRAGVPLGPAFSFLITSPVINEYVVVLMVGFFGWKIALAYVVSGLTIGIVSGLILGRMRLEGHLEKEFGVPQMPEEDRTAPMRWGGRLKAGWRETVSIVRQIWAWIIVGVSIGAIIHNFVPTESVQGVVSRAGIFAVPAATLLGAPLYGSCAAIIPVAVILFQKGVPLGTALAFTMAVAALSLPEAILLRRAMKLPLIAIFFGITAGAIVVTGYLFNALQPHLVM